jgi:MFS family permease
VGVALLGAAFVDWALVAVHVGRSGRLDEAWVPGLYALAMGLDGAAALAFGHAYDRVGLRVLVLAAVALGASGVLIMAVPGLWAMLAGIALWAIALGGLESVGFHEQAGSLQPRHSGVGSALACAARRFHTTVR